MKRGCDISDLSDVWRLCVFRWSVGHRRRRERVQASKQGTSEDALSSASFSSRNVGTGDNHKSKNAETNPTETHNSHSYSCESPEATLKKTDSTKVAPRHALLCSPYRLRPEKALLRATIAFRWGDVRDDSPMLAKPTALSVVVSSFHAGCCSPISSIIAENLFLSNTNGKSGSCASVRNQQTRLSIYRLLKIYFVYI